MMTDDERMGVFRRKVAELYDAIGMDNTYLATADDPVAAQEATEVARLSALAERALGHPLDPDTLSALEDAQSRVRLEQARLVALFDEGNISAEDYLAKVNDILARTMQLIRSTLGEERFQAIYGEAGKHPEGMIDREAFLKSARRQPAARSDS